MKRIDTFIVVRESVINETPFETKEEEEENLQECLMESLGYPNGIIFKVEFRGRVEIPE